MSASDARDQLTDGEITEEIVNALDPISFVHLQPCPGGFQVVVGPFSSAGGARRAAEIIREMSTRGPGYSDSLKRIPDHVLAKVAEACDHLKLGPGSFVLQGDGDESVIDVTLSKTSRARDPRPRPKKKSS
jgi:hypothetical protein